MAIEIPSTTVSWALTDSIKTKLETITGIQEVIIGTYDPMLLEQKGEANAMPCIEIVYAGFRPSQYSSQRWLRVEERFQIYGHTYVATPSRVDGDDMKSIMCLASAIKQGLFGFLDDASPPCTNFLFTNADISIGCLYQEYSTHLNTCIIDVGFEVTNPDTTA